MTEDEQKEQQIKICILGGKTVGKTRLAHKLAGQTYREEYQQTIEVKRFASNLTLEEIPLAFYDFPTLEGLKMKDAVHLSKANLIIFLFKDSSSFTELYQLLEKLSKLSAERQVEQKYVWEKMPIIYLVYSNYQEKAVVQTAQIFSILSEEIRNFNTKAQIKEFLWSKEDVQAIELRDDILKIDFYAQKQEEVNESVKSSNIESSNIYDSKIQRSEQLQINVNKDNHQQVHPDIVVMQNSELTANDFSEAVRVEEHPRTEEISHLEEEKNIQIREVVIEPESSLDQNEEIIHEMTADKLSEREQSIQIHHRQGETIEQQLIEKEEIKVQQKLQQDNHKENKEEIHENKHETNFTDAVEEVNQQQIKKQLNTDINRISRDQIVANSKERSHNEEPAHQSYEQIPQNHELKLLLKQGENEGIKQNEKEEEKDHPISLGVQNSNNNIGEQLQNAERQKQQRQERRATRQKKNQLMRPQQNYNDSDSKSKKQKAQGKGGPKGCGSNCEIM